MTFEYTMLCIQNQANGLIESYHFEEGVIIEVQFLLNRNITCFHETHEVFVARQHGDNLVRRDLASHIHGMDVKVSVLEGGKSIGKEIAKRGPIYLGDILASKPEADDECEMLERGKTVEFGEF